MEHPPKKWRMDGGIECKSISKWMKFRTVDPDFFRKLLDQMGDVNQEWLEKFFDFQLFLQRCRLFLQSFLTSSGIFLGVKDQNLRLDHRLTCLLLVWSIHSLGISSFWPIAKNDIWDSSSQVVDLNASRDPKRLAGWIMTRNNDRTIGFWLVVGGLPRIPGVFIKWSRVEPWVFGIGIATGWWFGCHFLLSHSYWVSNHPNWRTIFFRGVAQPPTRICCSTLLETNADSVPGTFWENKGKHPKETYNDKIYIALMAFDQCHCCFILRGECGDHLQDQYFGFHLDCKSIKTTGQSTSFRGSSRYPSA